MKFVIQHAASLPPTGAYIPLAVRFLGAAFLDMQTKLFLMSSLVRSGLAYLAHAKVLRARKPGSSMYST